MKQFRLLFAAWQGPVLLCTAPTPMLTPTSNLTVLLRLLFLTPVADATARWRGIGYPASHIENGVAVNVLDVSAMYSVDIVNRTTPASTSRLRRAAGTGAWRSYVYADKLMFTYTVNGETCGCDVDSLTTCDACGRREFVRVAAVACCVLRCFRPSGCAFDCYCDCDCDCVAVHGGRVIFAYEAYFDEPLCTSAWSDITMCVY